MSLRGSCLCKAVCYEVDQLDMPIGHCHCVTCRKAHAAAFASTAGVMRDQFRWTAGEEKLSAYESSPGKLRRFCSVCGTQLIAERPTQAYKEKVSGARTDRRQLFRMLKGVAPGGARRGRFVRDSRLEEAGFELSVPPSAGWLLGI